MKLIQFVAGMTLLFTLIPAKANSESIDFTLSAGTELFRLAEKGDAPVDEDGLRYFLAVDAEMKINSRWSGGVLGKKYGGWVDYDGWLLESPIPTPFKSDTNYNGWTVEAALTRAIKTESINGNENGWWLRFSLGYDTWCRALSSYNEDYSVTFSRLGALFNRNKWRLQAGLKYLFHTTEKVGLTSAGYDNDVRLSPPGDLSLYAEDSYRFFPNLSISVQYDSYRFNKSEEKTTSKNGITFNAWQPETHYDIFGGLLSYHF
jgi:hypothetical protein